ncbi:rRNA accumulation- protein [Coniosporium apollinis]|uniref:rRNA accumulation- protein n=2 Tax=Coniosporium TaxID=2810619 RepID=A0ABQ9NM05_9PEZI|nr:rRNA accumulation- protein [Cladosporium sp. JES 115]KAJ9661579.1 rRNA accumulation- protein [Coniosporium apollinis]
MASSSTASEQPQTQKLSPAELEAKLDLAMSLLLSDWPDMTLAVSNNWGGPDSSDKRDYLAGALSTLLMDPAVDAGDVQEVLLQYMADEFEVDLDDDSEEGIAERAIGLRREIVAGEFGTLDRLYQKWVERGGKAVVPRGLQVVEHGGDDEEMDSDDEDEDDEDEDVEMDGVEDAAPQLVKARPEPEVDEEGFTKVVGKKKR